MPIQTGREKTMRLQRLEIPAGIGRIILMISMLFMLLGCRTGRQPEYQFDDHTSQPFHASAGSLSDSPQLGVSPSGALFVLGLYGEGTSQQLGLALSNDMGDTFQSPVPVSESKAAIRGGGEASPSLSVTSTAIYALWEQTLPTGGPTYCSRESPLPGNRSRIPFESPTRPSHRSTGSRRCWSRRMVTCMSCGSTEGRQPRRAEPFRSIWLARQTVA